MTGGAFLDRLPEEGRGLMAATRERGIGARLIGGMAIRLLLGDRLHEAFRRPVRDLDLVVRKRDARALEELLGERGWEPHASFNALNGARRLLFEDPASDAQVDVFVEAFEMCHRLPLAEQLDAPGDTLPAADLLMTKLQIVELNAKDRGDLYALLLGCEVAQDGGPDAIDAGRIADVTARDWGLHHTFELNLAHLREALPDAGLSEPEAEAVAARIDALGRAMEGAPKSRGWKLRARVGERKQWYVDPEEVDRAGGG